MKKITADEARIQDDEAPVFIASSIIVCSSENI
jgi:hypothetical protein